MCQFHQIRKVYCEVWRLKVHVKYILNFKQHTERINFGINFWKRLILCICECCLTLVNEQISFRGSKFYMACVLESNMADWFSNNRMCELLNQIVNNKIIVFNISFLIFLIERINTFLYHLFYCENWVFKLMFLDVYYRYFECWMKEHIWLLNRVWEIFLWMLMALYM